MTYFVSPYVDKCILENINTFLNNDLLTDYEKANRICYNSFMEFTEYDKKHPKRSKFLNNYSYSQAENNYTTKQNVNDCIKDIRPSKIGKYVNCYKHIVTKKLNEMKTIDCSNNSEYKFINNLYDMYNITDENTQKVLKLIVIFSIFSYVKYICLEYHMLNFLEYFAQLRHNIVNMTTIEMVSVFRCLIEKNVICWMDNEMYKLKNSCYPSHGLNPILANCLMCNLNTKEEMLKKLTGEKIETVNYKWSDFDFRNDRDMVYNLLNRKKSFNLLIYGAPGTGKTEFVKTLCKKLKLDLHCLYNDETDEDKNRLNDIKSADYFLTNKQCLLIDEADDIFRENVKKDLINKVLDDTEKKHIFIMNDTFGIDKAFLRRFDYAMYFEKPNKDVMKKMWKRQLKNYGVSLKPKMIEWLVEKFDISPAFLTKAIQNVATLEDGYLTDVEKNVLITHFIENQIQTMNCGFTEKKEELVNVMKNNFNLDLLNTDVDLKKLADRILSLKKMNFSLCLNGISGTGKSAYAEWLAEKMGIPIIKKKCSDLLGMYVGQTEQNIANAFKEAVDNKAMLIFDEADSFLQNRNNAVRNWEVTQVNEMLTQMEKHPYPFICTTNLMDSLDKASLRRFTFKVKYDYMTSEQVTKAFEYFFGIKNVHLNSNTLAPGDFVVVKEKAEIMDCLNNKDELIKMLDLEQVNKTPIANRIGF